MNVIESLLADAERHEADLTRRVEELTGELKDTKHMLREVARHRERLTRDRSRGAPMLPLGNPAPSDAERELDEEEDADDADAMHAAHPVVGSAEGATDTFCVSNRDDGAATHWDSEDGPAPDDPPPGWMKEEFEDAVTQAERVDASLLAPKPKRGRKKAEAANA